ENAAYTIPAAPELCPGSAVPRARAAYALHGAAPAIRPTQTEAAVSHEASTMEKSSAWHNLSAFSGLAKSRAPRQLDGEHLTGRLDRSAGLLAERMTPLRRIDVGTKLLIEFISGPRRGPVVVRN